MLPQLPVLRDYDVSPRNGFLPDEIPLEVLPDAYYRPWETVVLNFQKLILAKRLRQIIENLPILETDLLLTEAEWRRAYSILGFMAHGYIWGGEKPADVSVCLWNWQPLFRDAPMDTLDNLSTQMTFTGSMDESWFYLVSVAIEARAGPIVPLMLDAIAAARHNEINVVTKALRSFAERLDELGALLERMYESCDPHVFYHRIRPYLAGSKNMSDAGLPRGVIFDDGTGTQPYVQFSGGSNAQSSIIQFFDIVLGVEHRPTGEKPSPNPSSSSSHDSGAVQSPPHGFIQDMRRYMPGPHRRFLSHMEQVANIREFVNSHRDDRALTTAYDACLAMLRSLRDKHIQLVSRYIIVKSREQTRSLSPQSAPSSKINLANTLARGGSKKLRGTGGTALIPFLKQARDETGEPAIDAWAKRLLNNGPGDIGVGAFEGGKMAEGGIVGLAGTWKVDDSEGGICHW
ncbi:hypothetical protein SNOG_10574 [Parastagonospora nodorum SN15]|uniref:Indoleamine 2,3-dioxygenase n=1 Tax=Phaeosphaeria nodorum (strain SN15 / ATCC MYA-4574 / FGSC 10173) TaxID=321614 RepID=Q0UCE0_PHANO|nr:hypothetical protein SNOG_10574 [Parastagonospora nodorum SN15]EAT81968.2 hypothetical protein SNOG_10574 [Parastagonospora nodorum SN15]